MGIYPIESTEHHTHHPDGTESWIEVRKTPGLIRRRQVYAQQWEDELTDCFCCSCGELGHGDPHCRNHGWVGKRPCEAHNMSGTEDDEGKMPISVQAERERRGG